MGLLDDLKMGLGFEKPTQAFKDATEKTMKDQRDRGKRRFQSTPSNSSGQNPLQGLLSLLGGSKGSDPNNTEDLGLGGLKSFFGNRENAPKNKRGDAMIRATMEDKLPGYFDPISRRYVPWFEDIGNKGFFNGAGDAGDVGVPTPFNVIGGLLGRDPAREGEYRTSQGNYEDYLTYGNPQPRVQAPAPYIVPSTGTEELTTTNIRANYNQYAQDETLRDLAAGDILINRMTGQPITGVIAGDNNIYENGIAVDNIAGPIYPQGADTNAFSNVGTLAPIEEVATADQIAYANAVSKANVMKNRVEGRNEAGARLAAVTRDQDVRMHPRFLEYASIVGKNAITESNTNSAVAIGNNFRNWLDSQPLNPY
jgi:hypothetical protein